MQQQQEQQQEQQQAVTVTHVSRLQRFSHIPPEPGGLVSENSSASTHCCSSRTAANGC